MPAKESLSAAIRLAEPGLSAPISSIHPPATSFLRQHLPPREFAGSSHADAPRRPRSPSIWTANEAMSQAERELAR